MNPERPHLDKHQLLKRWLTGDITRSDERKLESMATNDPFLADAKEGFESMPENEHIGSVTKLKAQLRQRANSQRQDASFYLLRVAAVGAVLLAGWLVFQQFDTQSKGNISETQTESAPKPVPEEPSLKPTAPTVESAADNEEKTDAEKAEVPNPMAEIAEAEEDRGEAVKREEKRRKQAAREKLAEAKKKDAPENETFKKADDEPGFAETEAPAEEATSVKEEVAIVPPAPSADTYEADAVPAMDEAARAGNAAPMVHKIVGKVTNDFGDPLTGASVIDEVSQMGTVTDRDGYFALETEAIQPNIRISYTGYEEKNLAVRDEEFLNVQLDESTAMMDEVIVTDMSKKAKTSVLPPQPKGGFAKLEKYIRKNLRRPDSEKEGEVILLFRIDEDGSPTDFEILTSLGEAFDEEAKRILQEGPKWEGDKTEKIRYSVRF